MLDGLQEGYVRASDGGLRQKPQLDIDREIQIRRRIGIGLVVLREGEVSVGAGHRCASRKVGGQHVKISSRENDTLAGRVLAEAVQYILARDEIRPRKVRRLQTERLGRGVRLARDGGGGGNRGSSRPGQTPLQRNDA